VSRAERSGASPARRLGRTTATLALTALCAWYIVAKVDFGEAAHVLANARVWPLVLAIAILVFALVPLSWRWQRLLRARGVDDGIGWLLRAYFVSYTAGQVLPTSLGGDATRIFETARRHQGASATAAASVLLERGLGGVATLLLGVVAFALAIGRYDVGPYLWLELLIALGTVALAVVVFSRRARRPLRRLVPLLERVRLSRPLVALYRALHGYRDHPRLLLAMLALTVAVQACRIVTIWLAGKAVGVDLSPLPYFVMGPLFFLVMLAPFTLNGFALREAFFVDFLGHLGVDADRAFATGFLYFLLSVALSLPGLVLWGSEGVWHLVGPGRRGHPPASGSEARGPVEARPER
jgi:uncharacterized protein (TIRG00374 family)